MSSGVISHDQTMSETTPTGEVTTTGPSEPTLGNSLVHPQVISSSNLLSSTSPSSLNSQALNTSSTSIGDLDGEGIPDTIEDVNYPLSRPAELELVGQPPPDSDTDSSHPSKRKASTSSEEDYMRQNPELYGLRRSGRARNTQQVIDDDDSDPDIVAKPPRAKRRKDNTHANYSGHDDRAILTDNPSSADESSALVHKNKRARKPKLESESDSEAEIAPKPKKRRESNGSGTPAYAEQRFSTRRAAKPTTYNEDDDEEEFLEPVPDGYEETYIDPDFKIDKVLEHRTRTDGSPVTPGRLDISLLEFKIKWEDRAYIHATWETWDRLNGLPGTKKVQNYYKHKVTDIEDFVDSDGWGDFREEQKLAVEREKTKLEEHEHIERVIDKRRGEDETEYLVKWQGLHYEDCTWENASFLTTLDGAQIAIDKYLDRTSGVKPSNKFESNLKTRSPFKPFPEKQQPDYIKGTLREFQVIGVQWMAAHWCNGRNGILADEMGLGKTVQTVAFMNWLIHDRQQYGPFLIIVPLSTISGWQQTFDKWAPEINYIIYGGKEKSRDILASKEMLMNGDVRSTKFNALLTTYESITKKDEALLPQIKWQFMAVDEAHRLKNRDSVLYKNLMQYKCQNRLLITGTPIQNTLSELSALMDFLFPGEGLVDENIDIGNSKSKFELTLEEERLRTEETTRKIAELKEAIDPYILRRMKNAVTSDLPSKTEKILRVDCSDAQLELTKNIATRNYAVLSQGPSGENVSLLNIVMELRKSANHPFLFPNAEDNIMKDVASSAENRFRMLVHSSGKMMLLDRLLTKLKKEGHRVLIFSQMVNMIYLIQQYLSYRGYQSQILTGMQTPGARKQSIAEYEAPGSNDFVFLLSTRAGGLGINLTSADTVILFDSDWNPQADLQAMGRAHRIGQTKPVTVYRLVAGETIEEEMLERARNKLILESLTIQNTGSVNGDPRLEAAKKKTGDLNTSAASSEVSRILKSLGKKMFGQTSTSNQKSLEELDIDQMVQDAPEMDTQGAQGFAGNDGENFLKQFEYTDVKLDDQSWDDIIPKEQLQEIKAEEEKKRQERATQKLIEESKPRNRKRPGALEEPTQRAAKRRARERTKQIDASDSEADAADDDDDEDAGPNADPKRPLSVQETRRLIEAFKKFGPIDLRGQDIVKDARLEARDFDLLKSAIHEVVRLAKQSLQDESTKQNALQQTGQNVTKKDKKAVLFDYNGVQRLNAETLIERPEEMKVLYDEVTAVSDFRNFRIPQAEKSTTYTCPWGAREDGMLCVGISRHGFGAWPQIRDDPDLGLGDKIFIQEDQVAIKEQREKATKEEEKGKRSPAAVHLVRRSNYLLTCLKGKASNGTNEAAARALANHHRNTKKPDATRKRQGSSTRHTLSPAPTGVRKAYRDSDPHGRRRSPGASHDRTGSQQRSTPNGNADRPTSQRPLYGPLRPHQSMSSGSPNTGSKLITASERLKISAARDSANMSRQSSNEGLRNKTIVTNGHKAHSSNSLPKHVKDSKPAELENGAVMNKFFEPILPEVKVFHHNDSSWKTKELMIESRRVALISIAQHILEYAEKKGSKFAEASWKHFAEVYVRRGATVGQVKKSAKRALVGADLWREEFSGTSIATREQPKVLDKQPAAGKAHKAIQRQSEDGAAKLSARPTVPTTTKPSPQPRQERPAPRPVSGLQMGLYHASQRQ